jgi:hypothetical protein
MICFFVSDLMFKSRIRETMGSKPSAFPRSLDELQTLSDSPKTIFIDLNHKKLDPIALIGSLRTAFPDAEVCAFGSHMDVEKLAAAEAAGAHEVLANSGFVSWLEGQRGAGFLTLFVFGLIAWALAWYLFHFIPIQYRFYELQNAMHSICKVSKDIDDKEMRSRLLSQMRDIGTPGDIQAMTMERTADSVRVQYQYQEDIRLSVFGRNFLLQSFSFSLDVTDAPQV